MDILIKVLATSLVVLILFVLVTGCDSDVPMEAPAEATLGEEEAAVGFTPSSKCKVPDVVALDQAAAEENLIVMGLQPVISHQYNDLVADGTVISQEPSAGTLFEPCQGDVDIYVSLGALPLATETPSPTETAPPPITDTPSPSAIPSSTPITSPDGWITFPPGEGFELRYPEEWGETGVDGIDFASIANIGPLKLLIFGKGAAQSQGDTFLSPEENYARFRETLLEGAVTSTKQYSEIEVELIEYVTIKKYVVYTDIYAPGTMAIWRKGERNFALIDEGSTQQENGVFDKILDSFKFLPD